jgi:hypothetical protein
MLYDSSAMKEEASERILRRMHVNAAVTRRLAASDDQIRSPAAAGENLNRICKLNKSEIKL